MRSFHPAVVMALLLVWVQPVHAEGPWSLERALGLPERLSLSGDVRVRAEYLDEQFRAGIPGDARILALRSRLRVGYRIADWLRTDFEVQDSRVFLENDSTAVDTGLVDTFALIQAFAQVDAAWPFAGASTLRLGRLTMDLGSRRLVARNRFRNTTNGFTGVDWVWRGEGDHEARAFYTLPVRRLPDERDPLVQGSWDFDEESFDTQFWGLYYRDALPWDTHAEAYWLGLHERDADGQPTRNRDLQTPGFRVWRAPASGRFDLEVETALQFGTSRSSATSSQDLDHFAHFHHLALGYSFDAAWAPRVSLHYDYASGDEDPDDDDSGRFDTLFGARRFEYGPTSIYGAFARANINTPGVRVAVAPSPHWTAFVAFRAFWLAQRRDAWTTAGVQGPTGDSGRYVGSQIEFRVRWNPLPGVVRIETGYAHLFTGEFIDRAPNSNREGDSNYVYLQTQLSF